MDFDIARHPEVDGVEGHIGVKLADVRQIPGDEVQMAVTTSMHLAEHAVEVGISHAGVAVDISDGLQLRAVFVVEEIDVRRIIRQFTYRLAVATAIDNGVDTINDQSSTRRIFSSSGSFAIMCVVMVLITMGGGSRSGVSGGDNRCSGLNAGCGCSTGATAATALAAESLEEAIFAAGALAAALTALAAGITVGAITAALFICKNAELEHPLDRNEPEAHQNQPHDDDRRIGTERLHVQALPLDLGNFGLDDRGSFGGRDHSGMDAFQHFAQLLVGIMRMEHFAVGGNDEQGAALRVHHRGQDLHQLVQIIVIGIAGIENGHPDVLVPGPSQGLQLARRLTVAVGDDAEITATSVKNDLDVGADSGVAAGLADMVGKVKLGGVANGAGGVVVAADGARRINHQDGTRLISHDGSLVLLAEVGLGGLGLQLGGGGQIHGVGDALLVCLIGIRGRIASVKDDLAKRHRNHQCDCQDGEDCRNTGGDGMALVKILHKDHSPFVSEPSD